MDDDDWTNGSSKYGRRAWHLTLEHTAAVPVASTLRTENTTDPEPDTCAQTTEQIESTGQDADAWSLNRLLLICIGRETETHAHLNPKFVIKYKW